jgi:hypothetical protein
MVVISEVTVIVGITMAVGMYMFSGMVIIAVIMFVVIIMVMIMLVVVCMLVVTLVIMAVYMPMLMLMSNCAKPMIVNNVCIALKIHVDAFFLGFSDFHRYMASGNPAFRGRLAGDRDARKPE